MQENLFSQEYSSESESFTGYVKTFSKTWKDGGVWGLCYLENENLPLERIGNLLSQSAIDLIMNSVDENRIRLIESILKNLKGTFEKTVESEDQSLEDSLFRAGMILILEDTIYIGILGKLEIAVDRGGRVLNFSKIISDENEIKVISGSHLETDILIISPERIEGIDSGFKNNLEVLSKDFIFSLGSKSVVTDLIDSIYSFVDEQESNANVEENVEDENSLILEEKVDKPVEDNLENENLDFNDDETYEKEDLVSEDVQKDDGSIDILEVEKNSDDSNDVEESYEESPISEFSNGTEKKSRQLSPLFSSLKNTFSSFFSKISPVAGTFFQKLLKFLGKISSWVIETIVGFGGRSKFKTEGTKKINRRRILLLLVIVVLGSGLYLSVRWIKTQNEEKNRIAYYQEEYSRLETLLNDAESKISYNSDSTKSILNQVMTDADSLKKVEVDDNKAGDLISRAGDILDQVEKRIRLSNLEVLADLKISYENAEPEDIVWFNNMLWVTDPTSGSIYTVSSDGSLVNQVLDKSSGLKEPKYLEGLGENLFVWDGKEGLFQIIENAGSYSVKSVTGLNTTSLGNVTEVSSYSSDNSLYFLVAEEGKIKKSVPAGTGYAYPTVRLQDESFKTAVDIDINGLIYTLGNGELVRYYGSDRDYNVEISGITPVLGEANKFELLASLQVLILDKDNKRIVVLNQPEGSSSIFKMDQQYTIEEGEDRFFNNLKELTIDLATNTVYILDGFRIIQFDLDE